jgi:coiled-coil domain-containing protein 12
MDENPDERRSRLNNLRRIARGDDKGTEESSAGEPTDEAPPIKFRNYVPQDSALQHQKKKSRPNDEQSDNAGGNPDQPKPEPDDIIAKELQLLKSEEINIVPKKANWDLKNQVSSKLEKLKRRTQRSIVEILREKIAADEDKLD